jgi:hypothetical protein
VTAFASFPTSCFHSFAEKLLQFEKPRKLLAFSLMRKLHALRGEKGETSSVSSTVQEEAISDFDIFDAHL